MTIKCKHCNKEYTAYQSTTYYNAICPNCTIKIFGKQLEQQDDKKDKEE